MAERIISPSQHFNQIKTGYFREAKGYYAFRPGGTDDWLLIYTISGRGRFGHAGGDVYSHPHHAVLISPGTRHDYGVEMELQQWELLWAHFHPRPEWVTLLDWPEEAPGLMRLLLEDTRLRKRVHTRLEDMNRLASGAGRLAEMFAMNALEEALLWCDQLNPRSDQSKIDNRVRDTLDYICTHLGEKLSLDRLAEIGGLSVSRLAHLFRDQVGLTPQQFIERQRLQKACQLLELTSNSVKEISCELGFDNPFYFTLRFKKAMGKSPRAWRRGK